MTQQVHIVPHTHWDREWYFTTEQSQILLIEAMQFIMDELESGNLPYFVLDGQSVMLQDYLEVMPEDKERVKALTKAGKLRVGPWYSQTDQCVVAAESLARNLLYGTRDCTEFGGHMEIGYVPDSFGQTEQLPQLFNEFGINRAVFWRGLWDGISEKAEFLWQSRDGSEVNTACIHHGYAGAKGMPKDDEVKARRQKTIDGLAAGLKPFNTTEHTLVMGGNDQQPWDKRIPKILEEINQSQDQVNYQLSSFEQFFESLEARAELKPVVAEMLAGKYSRTHRGIYSTRYDVKKANADVETLMTHQLEPLLTIGWQLGFRYPHGLMEKSWKTIMQSHAHDSIGCCNTDPVNASVKERLTKTYDLCRQQTTIRQRQITEAVTARQDGEKLVLFNTLPEARRELVTVEVVVAEQYKEQFALTNAQGEALPVQILESKAVGLGSLVQDLGEAMPAGQTEEPTLYVFSLLVDAGEIPALGYKTLYVRHNLKQSHFQLQAETSRNIENDQLQVTLEQDGTLSLLDKTTGQSMSGLLEFVDGGDDGDNYDFSPPHEDWLISTAGTNPEVQVHIGELVSYMQLDYSLKIPANLAERKVQETSIGLPVSVQLTLKQGARRLDVAVSVDNQAKDHRLQAVFRTGLETSVSYADQPFGMIKRDSQPVELEEWESANWTSKPLPLYPMLSQVALTDGEKGLAVMTNGIREYEICSENSSDLAITLYRSVGYLGKKNLKYRPGPVIRYGHSLP